MYHYGAWAVLSFCRVFPNLVTGIVTVPRTSFFKECKSNTQNLKKMNPKNIYNKFLTIIEKQSDLSDKAVKIALKHFDEHMRLRDFAKQLYESLRDKRKRTIYEETCYQELIQILTGKKGEGI